MHGLYERPNNGRDRFTIGLEDAKAYGGSDGIFMARRITAAMKIEADRRCFLLEGQAGSGYAEHDERHAAVHTGAAAAFKS